jgi:DNA-binding protein HU-beta
MRLKIAVSVVRSRPWAPFSKQERRKTAGIEINAGKSGISNQEKSSIPVARRNLGKGPLERHMQTKAELIQAITDQLSDTLSRKDVKAVLESLASVGYKQLKKNGAFVLPGFAKFVVIKKPATKARQGINPFTKEPMMFKAKPARKILRARPVKAAKDSVA